MTSAARIAILAAAGSLVAFGGAFAATHASERSAQRALAPVGTVSVQPALASPRISGFTAVERLPAMRAAAPVRTAPRATATAAPRATATAAPRATATAAPRATVAPGPGVTVTPQQPKPKPIPKT
jgi:hypothetical protein